MRLILFAVRSYHSHARRTFLTRFVQYGKLDQFTPVVLSHAPGPAYDWFCQQRIEAQLWLSCHATRPSFHSC